MSDIAYFNDLTFVSASTAYTCHAVVDHRFPTFCAVNFLYSGAIRFGRDAEPLLRLQAPAIYWTWEEPHWRYQSTGEAPWIHAWTAFRGPRAERMKAEGLLPDLPCPVAPLPQKQPAADLFDRMARLAMRRDPRDHAECVLLLERLLWIAQTARSGAARGGDELEDRIEALAGELRAEPFRDWQFPYVAREWGISYSHFRSRFRAVLRDSPHAYLLRCRMLQIARRLQEGESVKAVAYAHGYPDLGNFSRSFRRVIGVSPRQYLDGLPRQPDQ